MKPPSLWLWRLARMAFVVTVLIFATPTIASVAAITLGDVQVSWGHVFALIAAAAAWGDARTNRARDREEQKRDREEIRADIHEMRAEIKQLWAERR